MHHPRGRLRQTLGLLSPTAATAARIALERDLEMRVRRIAQAAADGIEQRVRPSRSRMRALVAAPGGRLRWRDVPSPPPPRSRAALVHPIAIATCDLDRPLAFGATPFPLPLHLGHECIAEVLTIGDAVTAVRPGDRVVVPFQISCGTCRACRAERTANCLSVPPVSMYGFGVGGGHWGGAYSDQLVVPYADAMLVPLPRGVDPIAAASVPDNVSDGYRHVGPYLPDLIRRDPEASVLIIVALTPRSMYSPSVPLYAGLVARALGARHVHFVDARPAVREHAARLGMHALQPRDLRGQPPAPLVVDGGARPESLLMALSKTAPDGVCSSVGALYRTARIPTGLLYGRNATLHIARAHARAVIPKVLELMTGGALHPELVTTAVAPLDDATTALREHFLGDGVKTILTV
jgi:alcohol dehydrogenase